MCELFLKRALPAHTFLALYLICIRLPISFRLLCSPVASSSSNSQELWSRFISRTIQVIKNKFFGLKAFLRGRQWGRRRRQSKTHSIFMFLSTGTAVWTNQWAIKLVLGHCYVRIKPCSSLAGKLLLNYARSRDRGLSKLSPKIMKLNN